MNSHINSSNTAEKTDINLYQQLLNSAANIIVTADNCGHITYINNFGCTFFGFKFEEIVAKNVVETILPPHDSRGRSSDSILNAFLQNPHRYRYNETQHIRKDGKLVWVAWTNCLLKDCDKNDSFLCIGTDITQQKRDEELLLDIAKIDTEKHTDTYFERYLAKLCQWCESEFGLLINIDKKSKSVDVIASHGEWKNYDLNDITFSQDCSFIGARDKSTQFDNSAQTDFPKDSLIQKLSIQSLYTTLLNESNSTFSVLWLASRHSTDLPYQKEKLLSLHAQHLGAELRYSTINAAIKKQQALSIRSHRLRSLGEMAAGLGHEFNQPLTIMRSAAENILFAKQRNWELSDSEICKRMQLIVSQTERMAGLIQHVQDLAKNAAADDNHPCDIVKITEMAISLIAAQFKNHNTAITFNKTCAEAIVYANPYALEETLISLFRNAFYAINEREKEFTGAIEVELSKDDATAATAITIKDNGLGMKADQLEKAFEPFFTTKAPNNGAGLGLASAEALIADLGGTIALTSEYKKGTEVSINLPLHSQ